MSVITIFIIHYTTCNDNDSISVVIVSK